MSIEDGDALDLKITINLKKGQEVAGSLSAKVGNVQILLLHRVMRLVQVSVRHTVLLTTQNMRSST